MTSETFEAEFVAYNQFPELVGVRTVDRAEFARTVEWHNAALHRGRGVLTALIDKADDHDA